MPQSHNPTSFIRAAAMIALLSAACSQQALAESEQSIVPSASEQEYITLAARVVATADACTALKIIDPGIGFLDEIEVGLLDFGASPEAVEEWMSNVIATKSPAIQDILKSEDTNAVLLQCTKDIDEKRHQLAAILSGEDGALLPEEVPGATDDTE